ncbi:class I SAM-dependent methyltransferase [Candidatus Woesearchaeota archaeon]|nr:class I SAM-dependent methyltransferase [Candidatus Woesearchaeota archaeon]
MILKKYLEAVYTIWPKFYDQFVDPDFYFDRNKAIKELSIKQNEKILEIGVGTGLNLPFYPKHCTVYGIDFSEAMLEKAKQKKSDAKVILKIMDAENMDFSSNFFDKVLITYVLRVTLNPKKVLKEIVRILKPRGKLIIVDQFKVKNSLFLTICQPLKFLYGSGRDYFFEDLIKGIPFAIKSKKKIGIEKRTYMYILVKK